MSERARINYIEFPARHLGATKTFFTEVFEWEFTDYGPDDSAFLSPEMEGGF